MVKDSQTKDNKDEDFSRLGDLTGFNDAISELDRETSRIVVRLELRKFRKPTTVVEGLRDNPKAIREVARKLKRALATGGTAKEGVIILQGDQRERTREELLKLGYSESGIEVQ
jgi:translation initiation factor 1